MAASRTITHLGIVASGACNLRCSYCRLGRSRASPPWTLVRPALDALLRSAEPEVRVTFTGGEPLLALPLIRRTVSHLARARRPAVRYGLLTNGLLLDAAGIAFLVRHRFDVQVSLDGGRAIQGRRSPATFDAVTAALDRLRRGHRRFFRDRVSVAATVTPATVPALARSVRFLLDRGVATIRLAAAMGAGSAPPREAALDRQFRAVFDMVREHFERTGLVPLEAFRKGLPLEPHRRTGWFCGAPTGRGLVLDADGRRAPCIMATATYAPSPPAAFRRPLRAIRTARGRAPLDTRGALRLFAADGGRYSSFSRCSACRWAAACTVCPLAAVQERHWDDPFRVPDFLCAFSRTLLKYRDLFPAQGDIVDGARGRPPC